ncbi:unnamed protein product [Linum trigynum]|uniref:Uncharacterized protein n=1 Tax=Linum trigynum TaxID=586398 RepID=A0AAV2EGU7_9ROSI
MTRSQSGGLLSLNPEIDRTCRQLRRQQRARLATEERIDGHLSSDSEEEHGMDGDYNQHQGIWANLFSDGIFVILWASRGHFLWILKATDHGFGLTLFFNDD